MKTFVKCFIAITIFPMAFFSCNKEEGEFQMPYSDPFYEGSAKNFAPVYTIYDSSEHQDGGKGSCTFYWEGSGSEPRFGKFFVKLKMCCDLSTGCYKDSEGYFEFKNGDKLYFDLFDGVITDNTEKDSDYYHKRIKELAIIKGGTGIFKDASGKLSTNAKIRIEPKIWKADCLSEGYLALTYEKNPIRDDQVPNLDGFKE